MLGWPPSLTQSGSQLNLAIVIGSLSRAGIGGVSVAPTQRWMVGILIREEMRHAFIFFALSLFLLAATLNSYPSSMKPPKAVR